MISRLHDENDDKRWGERKRGCVTYINQKESERTNHNQTNQLKLLLLLLQLLFCPFTFIHWCQIQKKLALCLNFKPLITTTIIIIIIIIIMKHWWRFFISFLNLVSFFHNHRIWTKNLNLNRTRKKPKIPKNLSTYQSLHLLILSILAHMEIENLFILFILSKVV